MLSFCLRLCGCCVQRTMCEALSHKAPEWKQIMLTKLDTVQYGFKPAEPISTMDASLQG